MRILFCGESFPEARRHLEKYAGTHGDEIVTCPRTMLRSAVENVDVVIPFMSRIDAALMDAGRFRLVHQWGAGLEGIDLEAARKRAIQVANVPASGNNADSVAEHALLLTIALLRDLPTCQAHVREGLLGIPIGKMLAGRTVCLYGLGAIARALARRLRPFGVRLVGITRDLEASKVAELELDACHSVADRNACLAQTDVLILCSRMTAETHGTIDAAVFRAMPAGSYLVNAARGGLVDYDALYASLAGGRLAGAGLDVFWDEPISPNDPLLALSNVIATPHIAGVTDRSYAEIAEVVANNLDRLRRGVELVNRVV